MSLRYDHKGHTNYYPLFRVRSWNNGMRCMSFYIPKVKLNRVYIPCDLLYIFNMASRDSTMPKTLSQTARPPRQHYKSCFNIIYPGDISTCWSWTMFQSLELIPYQLYANVVAPIWCNDIAKMPHWMDAQQSAPHPHPHPHLQPHNPNPQPNPNPNHTPNPNPNPTTPLTPTPTPTSPLRCG